jgi:hypothetical protein
MHTLPEQSVGECGGLAGPSMSAFISILFMYPLTVAWLQSIEHLRWDERKLDRVFNFTHPTPASVAWLGQEQLQDIQSNLEVR